MNTTISGDVRSEGRRAAHSPAFEILARIGFVARGVIYGTIGLLAIQVAIHSSNEKTNQRGAMQAIEKQPFGHWLLIAVAIGLGSYALWRFVQAGFGHGPEGGGDSSTMGRIVALSSGLAKAGTPPETLETTADVTFQPGEGITGIHLNVRGTVPGMSADDFVAAAEAAKTGCPVSKALAATPITLTATLT